MAICLPLLFVHVVPQHGIVSTKVTGGYMRWLAIMKNDVKSILLKCF